MKLNEHCKISTMSIKNCSDKIFVEQLRVIKFPDYLTNNCANHAYQEFAIKF